MKTNGLMYAIYAMDTEDEMDKVEEFRELIFWFGLQGEYSCMKQLVSVLHDLQCEYNEYLEDDMYFESDKEAESYFLHRVSKHAGIKVEQAAKDYTFEADWATWEWMKKDLDKWAELIVSKDMHLEAEFKRLKEAHDAKRKTQTN